MAELRARAHDLELLIALASVFSLLQVPELLREFVVSRFATWDPAIAPLYLVLAILLGGACLAVAALFVVNLLLRATWISVIGLEAHFTYPKTWRDTSSSGPVFFAALKATDNREQLAHQLDRLATSAFVLSITQLAGSIFALSSALVTVGVMALAAKLGLPHWPILLVVGGLFIAYAVLLMAISTADRRYGQKGTQPPAWLAKAIAWGARTQSRGSLRAISSLLQPFLKTRSGIGGYFASMLVFLASAFYMGESMVSGMHGKTFSAGVEASLQNGRVVQHYGPERLRNASAASFIIGQPLIQLQLPIVWARDEAPMRKLCGDAFRDALVACAKKYWRVSLNEAPTEKAATPPDWLLTADRETGVLMLEVFIRLEPARVGLHWLRVQRLPPLTAGAGKDETPKPAAIPVYFQPSEAQNQSP